MPSFFLLEAIMCHLSFFWKQLCAIFLSFGGDNVPSFFLLEAIMCHLSFFWRQLYAIFLSFASFDSCG